MRLGCLGRKVRVCGEVLAFRSVNGHVCLGRKIQNLGSILRRNLSNENEDCALAEKSKFLILRKVEI